MTALNRSSPDSDELPPPQRRPVLRWRLLLVTAVLVPLIGYFGVAGLIAAVTVSADGARDSLGVALVAAAPGWLAAFQVPMSIGRAPLSALPLLPTIGVGLLIAKASTHVVRRSRVRRPEQALWVILTMAFGHAAIGTALALAVERLPGPVHVVPGDAFACCGLVAATASALGVAHRCGLLYLLWERVPATLWWALSCGYGVAKAVMATGALVVVGALCWSVPEVVAGSAEARSPGDVFGSVVVSALYLPDAVLAAWSFTTGVGVSLGEFAFSPLGGTPEVRVLPALPLLALLPDTGAASWSTALFAVPVALGIFLGWSCRHAHGNARRRVWVAVTAAAVPAALVLVAGVLMGGHAGGGALDPISVHPVRLGVTTWGWLAFPAAVTAWFAGAHLETGDHAAGRAGSPQTEDAGVAALPDAELYDEEPAEDEPADGELADDEPGFDGPGFDGEFETDGVITNGEQVADGGWADERWADERWADGEDGTDGGFAPEGSVPVQPVADGAPEPAEPEGEDGPVSPGGDAAMRDTLAEDLEFLEAELGDAPNDEDDRTAGHDRDAAGEEANRPRE